MPPSELAQAVARLHRAAVAGASVVDEPLGKALLRAAGVATPPGRLVETVEQAVTAAAELGGPVALKIVAPELAHKTDVGGVAGPLDAPGDVERAASDLLGRLGGGLLVERWETGEVHLFVGLSLRGPLGPVITVGVGGIWVEVLRDVAHRAAPISPDEAVDALSSLRGAALLTGGRGRKPVDLPALADGAARISRLALVPEIRELVGEIDVNPLLARASGPPVALDCTVVLASPHPVAGAPAILAGAAS